MRKCPKGYQMVNGVCQQAVGAPGLSYINDDQRNDCCWAWQDLISTCNAAGAGSSACHHSDCDCYSWGGTSSWEWSESGGSGGWEQVWDNPTHCHCTPRTGLMMSLISCCSMNHGIAGGHGAIGGRGGWGGGGSGTGGRGG